MERTNILTGKMHIMLIATVFMAMMFALLLFAQPAHAESSGDYSMNKKTGTLTLTDYVSDEPIKLTKKTKIVVKGDCVLNTSGGAALNAENHDLTITGNGSLTLESGYVYCKNLTLDTKFTGNLTVPNMPGLNLTGAFTQRNGTVDVASLLHYNKDENRKNTHAFLGGSFKARMQPGIYFSGQGAGVIVDGCTVDVNGFITASEFTMKSGYVRTGAMPGVNISGNVTIDGGTMDIGSESSYGFLGGKNITINGGTINIYSAEAPALSGTNITLNGGEVTTFGFVSGSNVAVNGGSLDITSDTICLSGGSIVQTDGIISCRQTEKAGLSPLTSAATVSIKDGDFIGSSRSSIGIYAQESVTIDHAYVQCDVQNEAGDGAAIAVDENGAITIDNVTFVEPTELALGTATYSYPKQFAPTPEDHLFKVVLADSGSPAMNVQILGQTAEDSAAISEIAEYFGLTAEQAREIYDYAVDHDVNMDTIKTTGEMILASDADIDLPGAKFSALKARTKTLGKNKVVLTWSKIADADGYRIYGSKCGPENKVELLETITDNSVVNFTQSGLTKGKFHKYVVVAYKNMSGIEVTTSISPTIHALTKGGKYSVAKSVKITKVGTKKKATKITMKVGKSAKIKAKEIKAGKKIKRHRKLAYESDNPEVAEVTANGYIKAIAPGTCYVYTYAQNGVYKRVKVTVK